jgi:Tannase and feruloyl esterase
MSVRPTGPALAALLAVLALATPARAQLDPSLQPIAEALADVNLETNWHMPDLTTGPQRATNTVHADARAIAPANPIEWTSLDRTGDGVPDTVPGVLVQGTLKDDPQGRFLLRLPDDWNGKLVVAGASGTRSEFNGDLVISDFVLQKGYAYASQNKGMGNLVVTTAADPQGCPLRPVTDIPPGTAANPLLYFFLLDRSNQMREWGQRINQAALIAKAAIEAHYGRKPGRTYAMGVSNGGYQVRKAIEDHPQTFDGGVDWEGVFWREGGPNFIGELPAGLTHFPAYRASGFDPTSAAAQAIEAANYPPDLVLRREDGSVVTSLWTLNRFSF